MHMLWIIVDCQLIEPLPPKNTKYGVVGVY